MEELLNQIVHFVVQFFEIIFSLDVHLANLTAQFGPWMYVILFLIIFAETGLIIFPFLPGDSLLFAVGAICALEGSGLNVWIVTPLLIIAGILGDGVNYAVGNFLGPKVFTSETSVFLNRDHLIKTQKFYEKHGAMTIIIARFAPIIRTFAPFVAGIGKMTYPKFAAYNVIGAILWVGTFVLAGNFFGNLPKVKENFHIVIFAIIIISVMPMVISWIRSRREAVNA